MDVKRQNGYCAKAQFVMFSVAVVDGDKQQEDLLEVSPDLTGGKKKKEAKLVHSRDRVAQTDFNSKMLGGGNRFCFVFF